MKKKLLISLIVSFGINILLFLINLIYAFINEKVLLGFTLYGGEYSSSTGFGVIVEKIYSFGLVGEGGTTVKIGFDIGSFIVPFIILFILVFAISLLFHKNHKKKKK